MADEKAREAMGDEKTALNEKEQDQSVTMDELDSSKIKFINANGDAEAKVQISDGEDEVEFVGLTKDELMRYADDPYWVRVRWVLLILFWVAWFAMLAAAIVIIVLAPRCPPRPNLEWWQKSVVYQAYPKSFKDSNGDGVGDIKGLESKLDYLRDQLNVTAVWINPIYPSGGADGGYDITDMSAVDSTFGTLEDFESLRVAMHKKDIKLIMDFVPNHTSRNHTWFQQSRIPGEDNKYRDYYVWHDGKPNPSGGRNVEPNNWLSVMGGSAWTFDESRNQYYLHQFLPEQPDLNVRNAEVQEELANILRFWLEKGVDGFRIDAAPHLFESANITDNEPRSGLSVAADNYDFLDHTLTTFQPETYDLITEWRSLLDGYNKDNEKYRFLVIEAYGDANQTMPFYSYNGKKGADMPLNMNLINLDKDCNGNCVRDLVHNWMGNMPSGKWSSWVLGNHDRHRVASRVGEDKVNAVTMLQMTLPGTPFVYYGDEIGMTNGNVTYEQGQDKGWGQAHYAEKSRDFERTPMQWNTDDFAGFTSGDSTWLPVNSNYKSRNVKSQFADGSGVTNIEVFQQLTLARQEPSLQWGEFHYAVVDENIFSFVRQAERFPGFAVIINFGESETHVDLRKDHSGMIPRQGKVVVHTANFDDHARATEYDVGETINLGSFNLHPTEGILVTWNWGDEKLQEADQ